jgi:hypothetical protein
MILLKHSIFSFSTEILIIRDYNEIKTSVSIFPPPKARRLFFSHVEKKKNLHNSP